MEGISGDTSGASNSDDRTNGTRKEEIKLTQPGIVKADELGMKSGPETAREMSANIKPTVLPAPGGHGHLEDDGTVPKEKTGEEQEDLDSASMDSLERENNLIHVIRTTLLPNPDQSGLGSAITKKDNQNVGDSISFVDSTWEESLVLGNITHDDGRLNREKMAS